MIAFSKLLKEKKNFIFIGETGSGKSEIALNVAVMLKNIGERGVHVFDLDQTKANFRARDAQSEMAAEGIEVHYMPQLLDTPVMVNGIIPHIMRKDSAAVLDVGGNENASRMVGCLSDYLNRDNTAAIYVLNPYRPWSGTIGDIRETMETVLSACHLENIYFVGNPTVGGSTEKEDFELGMEMLFKEISPEELSCIFVKEDLDIHYAPCELFPLHRYLVYPWDEKSNP